MFSKLHHLENAEIYPTSVINKKIITQPGINNLLNHLHLNKTIDPDGLGILTLKHLSPSPKKCLSLIFQTFIYKTIYPYQWKISRAVHKFTDLDKIQINRLRPIGVLNCLSKIFEKHLFDYIYEKFKDHLLQFKVR